MPIKKKSFWFTNILKIVTKFIIRSNLYLLVKNCFFFNLVTCSLCAFLLFLFVIRAGRGVEKRKCAFMQNRPTCCPLTSSASRPTTSPSGSWMASNGERSQLGSHGSYMNACMWLETLAMELDGSGVPRVASWLRFIRGRYQYSRRSLGRVAFQRSCGLLL